MQYIFFQSVETRTYAELNLIVDAGSALGLWIGTSGAKYLTCTNF